jgi:hypothetical protein
MSYAKKASKLYNVTDNTKEKCVVKLKRRHIITRPDDSNSSLYSETNYKLTPFTTVSIAAVPQSQKSSSEPSYLTINEVQQDINGQEMLRSLRFVCASKKDALSWADAIKYNVISVSQAVYENKIHKRKELHDSEDDSGVLPPHKNIQTQIVNTIIELSEKNEIKRRVIKCCGYLIRRNHTQQKSFHHQQVYRKPSITFTVLYATGDIGFYHAHDMRKVADVVAFKADLVKERASVEPSVDSDLAFVVQVGDDVRELFVASDKEQREMWIKRLQEHSKEKPTERVEEPTPTETVDSQSPEDTREELDLSQFGIGSDSDDEDGGGTVMAKEPPQTSSNNNAEVYIPGLNSDDDEDDGEGSVIVSRKPVSEEPNIFGNVRRGDIFGNDFWSAPAEVKGHRTARAEIKKSPTTPIHDPFDDELQKLRNELVSRDKEIATLKETLSKTEEKLKQADVENNRLRSLLEKR